jgi:hypothetical protein
VWKTEARSHKIIGFVHRYGPSGLGVFYTRSNRFQVFLLSQGLHGPLMRWLVDQHIDFLRLLILNRKRRTIAQG